MKTQVIRPEPPKNIPPFTGITITFTRDEALILASITGSFLGFGKGRELTDGIFDAIEKELTHETSDPLLTNKKIREITKKLQRDGLEWSYSGSRF